MLIKAYKSIYSIINNSKIYLILSLALILISVATNVALPLLFSNFVAILFLKPIYTKISFSIFILYGFIWIFSKLLDHLKTIILSQILFKSLFRLHKKYIQFIFNSSISYFYSKKIGEIIHLIKSAESAFANIFWQITTQILPIVLELILSLLVTYRYTSIKYSIMLLLMFLCYIFYTMKLTKYNIKIASRADKIIVVNSGEVVSVGKHSDLIQKCSMYQTLWQANPLNL